MTRFQLRETVRSNLADAGITYYKDDNINDVLQDAYDLITAYSQCLVKSVVLNWQAKVNYHDFITNFNVTDYMGCIAIFNNSTNQWLRDDISMRDFDRVRRDWEEWTGTPQFWAPHSLKYVAIAPHYPATPTPLQFTLWYYAQAPQFSSDSDIPLIAADMQDLIEFFATGDLLESAEEPVKAQLYFDRFTPKLLDYKERCHNLAKYELLLRI